MRPVDHAAAARLAQADAALAALPEALASVPPWWVLHDLRWVPGRGCRLAYRVEGNDAPPAFVTVDVGPTGWSQFGYLDDPALPGLARAAAEAAVLEPLSQALGERVHACTVQPVRYRPGSRCVLRYDAETLAGTRSLYAKVLTPPDFAKGAAVLAGLAAQAHRARLVPEVVADWPDGQVLVTRGVAGRVASAVLGDPAVPAGTRLGLAHRLGDVAARFHAQDHPATPAWTTRDQLGYLAGTMEAVRVAAEDVWADMRGVLDALADSASPGPAVLAHGSMRAGQAVVPSDGRVVLLDIDKVAASERERDLGSLLAHLSWQAVRLPAQADVLRQAERAVVAGYERRAGATDPERLRWWHAACLLQVVARRYRRLESADWPLLPGLVGRARDLAGEPGGGSGADPDDLLDLARMTRMLGPFLTPKAAVEADSAVTLATAPKAAVEVESAVTLATAAGRRSSVRYAVRGLPGRHPASVVGKAFTDPSRARLLYTHLCLLHAGPFHHGPLRVPEPLAFLPERRLVLYRTFDGTPMDRLAPGVALESAVVASARWLAELHGSALRLPRRLSLEQEGRCTRQWAESIAAEAPWLARRARRLAEDWLAAALGATPAAEVPIHKDFHAGHVLVGDGICVIDLDEARLGDPAFDVAHFCAYLTLARGGAARALRDRFLTEYVARSGWRDPGSYEPFAAYTWLKIAKQWAVGSGPGRGASPERRATGIEQALRQGAACLSA